MPLGITASRARVAKRQVSLYMTRSSTTSEFSCRKLHHKTTMHGVMPQGGMYRACENFLTPVRRNLQHQCQGADPSPAGTFITRLVTRCQCADVLITTRVQGCSVPGVPMPMCRPFNVAIGVRTLRPWGDMEACHVGSGLMIRHLPFMRRSNGRGGTTFGRMLCSSWHKQAAPASG